MPNIEPQFVPNNSQSDTQPNHRSPITRHNPFMTGNQLATSDGQTFSTPSRMIVDPQKWFLLSGSLSVTHSGRKRETFHGFDNIQLSLLIT